MKRFNGMFVTCIVACGCLLSAGCSSFRSDIHGAYGRQAQKQTGMKPVDILFHFTHKCQTIGIDVIPKLEKRHRPVDGFDDIFADALQEIGNIGSYATFNDRADDVNQPERRALKDSLTASHDYVIYLKLKKETSFAKRFLGATVSTVSATLLPIPYSKIYSVHAAVKSNNGLIREYSRSASVTTWVQTGLIFLYPFHPEKRKMEEIYVEFLHDIFFQIEADGILTGQTRGSS